VEGVRVRRADRPAAGHGSDAGRDRPDAGPARWIQSAPGLGGHDRRRQVRRGDDARTAVVPPKLRVAVLAGGRSSEHEISLASARSVLEALDPERYDVRQLAIGRDGRWELGTGEDGAGASSLPIPSARTPAPLGPIDVVLPILHGPFGEDGTV